MQAPAVLRILVHDYSGHPFQVQLSRELARRGHTVVHVTSADFQTPKGRLDGDEDEPGQLTLLNLTSGRRFQKDAFVRRRAQERAFGLKVGAEIGRIRPDIVLSGNAPLDAQHAILKSAHRAGAAFVFWVQDLYSEAIERILKDRFGLAGQGIGRFYRGLEYRMLRASDAAVVISPDFAPILARNGVPPGKVEVIENWGSLEDLPYAGDPVPTAGPVRFTYSGTLGYKHDPSLLQTLAGLSDVEVRVYSEGRAADKLTISAQQSPNLRVRPWVPFGDLPAVLAGSDVLIAMIEADAGVYSVPSKILTYLCAGRPVLASVPVNNLARRILHEAGAGLLSAPGDVEGFLHNARTLAAAPELRVEMGRRARAYAERHFKMAPIGDRFEDLLRRTVSLRSARQAAVGGL